MFLMVGPMMAANATISADGLTSGDGSLAGPYIMRLDVNTQTISASVFEPFGDSWLLELTTPGVLEVTFATQTIDALGIVINPFISFYERAVDADGIYSLNLAAGSHHFSVIGMAGSGNFLNFEIGGIYSVTTSFSAIPLPASLWLLFTAFIGMMLSRNRKLA